MPGSILGVRFKMITYPSLPGTIGPFLCRLSQQTIQFSIHAGFSIFKESIININIKIITNELDGLDVQIQSTPAMNSYNVY